MVAAFLQSSNLVIFVRLPHISIIALHWFWTSNRNLSFFSAIIWVNMFRRGRDIDWRDKIYGPLVLPNYNSNSPIEENLSFSILNFIVSLDMSLGKFSSVGHSSSTHPYPMFSDQILNQLNWGVEPVGVQGIILSWEFVSHSDNQVPCNPKVTG